MLGDTAKVKYEFVIARLCHPVAFATYAVAGAGAVLLGASLLGRPFDLDDVQLLGIWLGIVAALFVLTARWDRVTGRSVSSGGEPHAGTLHHQPIWIALIGALVFSFLQNYAEYRSLQDRLTQLHGDVIAQTNSVQEQLLHARYDAETLSDDLAAWASTSEEARSSLEVRVSADLTNLDGQTQEASTHLVALVDRLGATTAASQPTPSLSQSTLASVRNLADDAAQEARSVVQTFDAVDQSWQSGRAAPGAGEQLQYAVNPRLWLAIDNASSSAQLLSDALTKATTVPVGDLFVVMAVLNLSCVLFPWLLLLLFVSGRRDMRLRQIYLDLWDLGGRTNEVLVRVLDRVDDTSLKVDGYKKPDVRRALEDRTFSDIEYLLCLVVLTVLLTAGWHVILYPMGALGLAQLVVNGVSARDFAMYVVGNLNVISLGFLGAYFYSVGVLIRRFFAYDLYPSAFLQMIYRVIIVFVISLVLTILVPIATVAFPDAAKLMSPFAGLPAAPNGGTPLDGSTALACALAFFFGIWTPSFYLWLPRLITSLPFAIDKDGSPQAAVSQLEGVDLWVEGRLNEEGIETVQAMATAAIERLVRRTYFTTARIVCWVDQALLYMHAGNGGQWMQSFRAAGIHKATDLIGAVGYAAALRATDQQSSGASVDLASVRGAVDTLALAASSEVDPKGARLSAETIFEVCGALWDEPNLLYVVNFYEAHRVDLRWAVSRAGLMNGLSTNGQGLQQAAGPESGAAPIHP
jgi:hypothetical protein